MKKGLIYLMGTALIAAAVVAGGLEFPKYAVRFAGFSVFLLIDLLYWPVFRDSFTIARHRKQVLAGLYWFRPRSEGCWRANRVRT